MEEWIDSGMKDVDSATFLLVVLFGGCLVFFVYSVVRNPKGFLKYVWRWLTTKEDKDENGKDNEE